MKKEKNIGNWLFPFMILALLVQVSCKPDEENLGPMRMFTPAGTVTSTSSINNVRLSWKTPANAQERDVTYTVEVASDTLFQTPIVLTAQTDSSGIVLTDEQLEVQQRYYARVKANAVGNRPESNWLYSSRFMIRGEQIILPPGATDITNNAAIIRWSTYPGLTRIVLTPLGVEGAAPIEVELNDADRTARMKLVTGLEPVTSYRVQIFQNNIMRGFTTIRTISGIAGTVVDLTKIRNRPNVLTDTLLSAAVTSGSTIVLAKGITYNISTTINLDKSITIMSEISTEAELANIYFTSNFNVAAGSTIDSVVFRDVHMQSDNYGSRYVMNINNASTVRNIKFDGAHAEIFRGIVRLQGAVLVDNFSVINSVIDSVANYGVLSIDNTGAFAHNILFSNSTFYKVERPIFSRTTSNGAILIENSTFNETPEGTRYIIDYGTNNVRDGVTINNSIFGIGKAFGTSREGRGVRVGTSTVQSSGSYSTADRVVTSNPIPGLIQATQTSFQIFQDPKAGNFTIIDPTFPGRNTAGDPRWRP